MWDLDGRELVPYGYSSWTAWRDDCMKNNRTPVSAPETQRSDKNPLSAREISHVLVEELIVKNRLRDPSEIKALREEAAQNSDVFIDELLGRHQL